MDNYTANTMPAGCFNGNCFKNCTRKETAREALLRKAKFYRDKAYKLEKLADEMHIILSEIADEALCELVNYGLRPD